MENKSVIFVTGSLADGGAEKVMSILASGCAELGADVTLVVLRNKEIMSERADPSAKLSKLPWKDKIGSFLMRRCGLYGLADWMVFQTPDAQAYYSKDIQKKSSIIPNPLDVMKLPKRYEGIREKRIVAAGRFSEEKNFPLLIEAFYDFHKEFPDYTLTIYGEGTLGEQYKLKIKELNLTESVSMPGFASNLPKEINRAAIYVSTSNHEGISNSMLEALGMGVPTIVTDCPVGGARMFVHTDENGILIPMNSKESLISAMKRIVMDKDYSLSLSKKATQLRETLQAENVSKNWLDLI